MLGKFRRFVNALLPWYDEDDAQVDAERTRDVIRRSIHRRHRDDQLLATVYPVIERRRIPRSEAVRDDYRRADGRIRGR